MGERTCKACGGRLGENARVCKRCGAPVEAERKTFLSSPWFLIPGGTVLAAIVLFSGARMILQLAAGTFPREGFYLSAGIAVFITALAFAFGRLWALHAAGLNDARYRRALWEAQTSGRHAPRRIARPVLLAVCLLTAVAVAAALLLKPAEKSDDAPESAAAVVNAESASDLSAAEDQPPAAGTESKSIIKLNGVWNMFTDETSGGLELQKFMYFDDEKALYGNCIDTDDIATELSGGSPSFEVTFEATYDYEVTAVSFIDVRGMDAPYIAAAEIAFTDRSGACPAFTARLSFNHVLSISDYKTIDGDTTAFKMFNNDGNAFFFDPAEAAALPEATIEFPTLYGFWVASESYDSFASFDVHANSDIPFLFFNLGTLYVGTCASASDARNFIMTLSEADSNCVITGTYPFVGENITYAIGSDSDIPYADTGWITVHLDSMAAIDLLMEENAYLDWDGVPYRFTEGVVWEAPW